MQLFQAYLGRSLLHPRTGSPTRQERTPEMLRAILRAPRRPTSERVMLKVIVLLHRREGMSVEDFRRHWRETHAPLLLQLPGLRRLVFNYGQSDEAGGPPTYDGISEDWFESAEAMQLAFASPQGEAVATDAPNFVDVSRIQTLAVSEDEVEVPAQSAGD